MMNVEDIILFGITSDKKWGLQQDIEAPILWIL